MQAGDGDPFGTARLRATVLAAWAASPARFREDANAEEDYALGGYRDRVIVELAQNAADAAVRAGVPGKLRLTLADRTLVAANTGAPLDADGVAALSSLRASAKRDDGSAPGQSGEAVVGRFGVGFAAAAAVSDEPRIASVTGAVSWSRREASRLVAEIPALAGELSRRAGQLPVLRLPFAADGAPPAGFATAVTLPLRDDAAVALVERLLDETGPALLLALPALESAEIVTAAGTRQLAAARDGDVVTISIDGVEGRWRTAVASGRAGEELLAGRGTEERARPHWSVRWAVPLADGDQPAGRLPEGVSAVVHAPTPTDERLELPALLIASFPLGPDRRHVAPGPLTGFLLDQAAEVFAGLLPALAPGPGLLDLVPAGLARGELDGQLRERILARLAGTAFLPAADGSGRRVRPGDALVLEASMPSLAARIAPVLPDLIAAPARHPALGVLGVRGLPLAEMADLLAGLDREPDWWRDLYAALADGQPGELAELGALPVPLADGRMARGPRGLVLPGPDLPDTGSLSALGLRVAAPGAVHPLLMRLGATDATPRAVLADPAVRAAVEASLDEEDPEPIADAVLALAAAAGLSPDEHPWLADLALPGADGDWHPAGELLLPGSPLVQVLAPDGPFDTVSPATLARHGAGPLEAAGVLSGFSLLSAQDVVLDEPDLDLDGAQEWADDVRARLEPGTVPLVVPEMLAVRDLELVDPERWPQALSMLAQPPARAAVTEPARVLLADGRYADVPSYTSWWLRHHPVLRGRRPGEMRAAQADPLLAGLYDEAELPADAEFARALGVRTSLAELLAEPGGADELLTRLADPARRVSRAQLRQLWIALAGVTDADPPDRVRAVQGGEVVVADADDTLVLDAPDLWPLVAGDPLVLAPAGLATALADLLDLPLASEDVPGQVESEARLEQVPATAWLVLPDAPSEYHAHDRLVVDGTDVPWRYADGAVHATGTDGLACGLAWAAGRWPARHLLASLLRDPLSSARLLADADLDDDGQPPVPGPG